MFEIKGHKTIIKDIHLISKNRLSILSDGHVELLYTGINQYENRILGVIMSEDEENEFYRYSHILITEEQYNRFLNQKISLRQILEINDSFFLIDINYRGKIINSNLVAVSEVPNEYLPLEHSLCPEIKYQPSLDYGISLKGLDADRHLSNPTDLFEIGENISDFLLLATSFLNTAKIDHNIFIRPYATGSFRINFKVELNPIKGFEFYELPVEKISHCINGFISYIFNDLPIFANNSHRESLVKNIQEVYKEVAIKKDYIENVEIAVDESINKGMERISEIDFTSSFDKLEMINYTQTGNEVQLGLVNQEISKIFSDRVVKTNLTQLPVKDSKPSKFNIQVYQFNKNSGVGTIYLDKDGKISKISLHVSGRKSYENTIFTKSLHEDIKILIDAVAVKKDDKIIQLVCVVS